MHYLDIFHLGEVIYIRMFFYNPSSPDFNCSKTTFKINIAPFLSTTSLYSAHRTSKTQLGQPVLHLHEEANSYPYSTKSVNNGEQHYIRLYHLRII